MDLDGLAVAAMLAQGGAASSGRLQAEKQEGDSAQKRYPSRRRSSANTAGSAAASQTSMRSAAEDRGSSTIKNRGNPAGSSSGSTASSRKAGSSSVNPRVVPSSSVQIQANQNQNSQTSSSNAAATATTSGDDGGLFSNNGNQIGFSVPTGSAFEAHLPMPAYGSAPLVRSASSASTASTSTADGLPGGAASTAQSTPDVHGNGNNKTFDPHMAVMTASNALVSRSSPAAGSNATLPLLPPMPQPVPPHKRIREQFEDYHDYGEPVAPVNYSGIDPAVAALVPPRKQKGRRPNVVPADGKNHKCSHMGCSWTFSRREHLKRHEKTHTQERPFACDVPLCGLRFSRLDNLNSHKRTHEKGKRTSQWHVAKVNIQEAAYGAEGQEYSMSEGGSMSPYEDSYTGQGDIDVPALPPLPPQHLQQQSSTSAAPSASANTVFDAALQQQVDNLLKSGGLPPLASPTSTTSGSSAQPGAVNTAAGKRRRVAPVAIPEPDYSELTDEEEIPYR